MISIDIGSKKVCVAEGVCRSGNVTITSWGEIEFDGDVVDNGHITDRVAVSFLINEIIKTKNMRSKSTVVSLNSTDIIARDLKLPNVGLANLKLLVNNEMARVVREDSGYIIDFVVTGTAGKMLNVNAYAVARELIETYYTLLKELKLSVSAFDVHANAMSKLLHKTAINGANHDDINYIVADIGFSKICFHGFSGGVCRFNRTEVSPVQEFVREIGSLVRADPTAEIMAGLNLSQDCEQEDPLIFDTCKYFIYRLSEEMQRYIQYMVMNCESKTMDKIYLCGGISLIRGIGEALSDSLRIPVEPLRKIEKLNVPQHCDIMKVCNAAGALIRL